jgi:hypothetical protein
MVRSLKMAVFWDVALCSLVDSAYIVRVIKAVSSSQTLVIIY